MVRPAKTTHFRPAAVAADKATKECFAIPDEDSDDVFASSDSSDAGDEEFAFFVVDCPRVIGRLSHYWDHIGRRFIDDETDEIFEIVNVSKTSGSTVYFFDYKLVVDAKLVGDFEHTPVTEILREDWCTFQPDVITSTAKELRRGDKV